jgi:hypothetical protein
MARSCESPSPTLHPTRRSVVAGLLALPALASRAEAAPVNYAVPGLIVPMQQPNDNACWATTATMMVGWKNKTSMTIQAVLQTAGAKYLAMFNDKKWLPGDQKPAFLAALGLKAEAPQNYLPAGWEQLLKRYGPLWVTTFVDEDPRDPTQFSTHARVLTAITGDGTSDRSMLSLIDPGDGKVHTESVTSFAQTFEEIARKEKNNRVLTPQVVHF